MKHANLHLSDQAKTECNPFGSKGWPHQLARDFLKLAMTLLALLAGPTGYSQVIVFLDDFSGYPDGTTAGPNWYTVATDCDDASPNEGLGVSAFGVYNGQFTANDSEGSPCCPLGGGGYQNYLYIEDLPIDSLCELTISYFFSSGGGVECGGIGANQLPLVGCAGTSPPDGVTDQYVIEYSIDGAPYSLLFAGCPDAPGSGTGNSGFPLVLNNNSTISFRISLANNEDDEYLYFDLLSVIGTEIEEPIFPAVGPLCETDPPYELPNFTLNGGTGTWNVGPYFDPSNHGGDTVTIYFTPDPESDCIYPGSLKVIVLDAIPLDLEPIGPFCEDETSVPLDPAPDGVNGTWSGLGVSGSSFSPAYAGVGTHVLTFTPSGAVCSSSGNINVAVLSNGAPVLGNATLCSTANSFDLTTLQDPDYPDGSWQGQGVTGSSFNPNGLSGPITLTFVPDHPCATQSTTNILVTVPVTPSLATANICSFDDPLQLTTLNDPAFPGGTWSGPGVSNDFFDPSGLNGIVTLNFSPTANCANDASTEVVVTHSLIPILGTANLCSDSPPFGLAQLQDPNFPDGTWSGTGVVGSSFDPTGIIGTVTLAFTPSANCVLETTTIIEVNPIGSPALGMAVLCQTDSPLNLSLLVDPDYPNGTWSGPGVTGNNFNPNGLSGNVVLSFSPSANCAATATTAITVNAPPNFTIQSTEDCSPDNSSYLVTLQISGGTQPYTVNGNAINGSSFLSPPLPSNSNYSFEIGDASGCGTGTISGAVNCSCPATSANIAQTLCSGSSLTVGGVTFDEGNPTGTVTLPLANYLGCDSVVNVSLTFANAVSENLVVTLCPDESLTVNGIVYSETNPNGTQVFPGGSSMGCDSTLSISVAFLAGGDTTYFSATTCDPTSSGVFVQNMSSWTGCDSTVVTTISLASSDTTLLYSNSCDPSSVGQSVQNLTNSAGCDSTVITTVLFSLADTTFLFSNTCDPGAAGQTVQGLTGSSGCDSVVITTIGWIPSDTTLLAGTSCDPSNTGVFYQNLSNTGGCDSIVITTITYSLVDTTLQFSTTCNPTEAGVLSQAFVTPEGCDSLVITTVALLPASETLVQLPTCDPSAAGVFTAILPNQFGCDSTITTVVSYAPIDTTWLTGFTCDPALAGNIVQNLISANGCDSVTVTTVGLQPSDNVSISATTCDPSQAGVSVFHYPNQYGCDSMVTLTTVLLPTDTTTIELSTCDPLQVGTTSAVLQNQQGCDSVVVTATALLPPQECSVELTIVANPAPCASTTGSISFSATQGIPPFDYEIKQSGSVLAAGSLNALGQLGQINGLASGVYELIVTSANGLSSSQMVTVGQLPILIASATVTSAYGPYGISCQAATDGSAQAIITGGTLPYTYLWSNGETGMALSNIGAGNYTVTVTDANGCTASSMAELDAPPTVGLSLTVNDPDCFFENGGLISLSASGGVAPYLYSLNGGAFQADGDFGGLTSGIYQLGILDANGCTAEDIAIVNAPVPISVDLGDDMTIALGEGASLSALVNVPIDSLASVIWTNLGDIECPDCLEQQLYPLVTTTYSIQVVGENGCSDDDEVTVYVNREKHVYVPNGFSPNGDGINDVFMVYAKPGTVKEVRTFLVFSRWGETVHRYANFLPGEPAAGWDGQHRGQPFDPGVFTWFAVIEFKDGEVGVFKGDVTLVR